MDASDRRVPRLMKGQKKNCKGKRKNGNSCLKVVYISSPMKVKTSASRFRSLVQQLTGKNSDVSHYMEANNNYGVMDFLESGCEDDQSLRKEMSGQDQGFSSVSSEDTPTSSDSLEPIDNGFTSQMEKQFEGIFSFFDPSEMDVLGSYDELF